MNKNAIKNFAVWARVNLIDSVKQKAYEYEITDDEPVIIDSAGGRPLTAEEKKQRSELVFQIKSKGYEQVMEETAYTWFNRFIALRFMEVNGYLPSKVRIFTNENGDFKPDIMKEAMTVEIDGLDREKIFEMLDSQDNEKLYKYLLITQCNSLNSGLLGMFEKIGGYTELLFPNNLLKEDNIIGRLVSDIPESDWLDEVQIIGWLYQYYNTELKDETFALLKKNVKITKERIPAATQLFTPDWIVRYMVENSLGRLWAEGHEDFNRSDWKYYLDEAEQEESVKAQLDEIRSEYRNIKPEQIKFIDPCMGSGHILVYAFDVLMQIYTSCGWSEREAAASILQHNLFGLDIDKRAYQLAYFALMMKARKYSRRILNSGIQPNLCHFQDISGSDTSMLPQTIKVFAEQFRFADTYGSLLEINAPSDLDDAVSEFTGVIGFDRDKLEQIMQIYKILSQKYDVVCTNPPYMGGSGMSAKLSDFVKNKYPDSKSDLFAVFIERGNKMAKPQGYNCMVTMQSWMFLSSFENMRKKMLSSTTITNLMHMENMVMHIAFGTAVSIFRNVHIKNYKGTYNQIKLNDLENDIPKSFPIDGNRFAQVSTENFSKIPGSPVAYWVSANIQKSFEEFDSYGQYGTTKKGVLTGNDVKFTRLWFEVSLLKIGFGVLNYDDMIKKNFKWIPATSGGCFRKWYGNLETIINMENDSYEIRYCNQNNFRLRDNIYYFRECITWSEVSSKLISNRYVPQGILFGNSGPVCFFNKSVLYYLSGLLNSVVSLSFLSFLSPTMTFGPEQIKRIPVFICSERKKQIDIIVKENIEQSKKDWDSFETSWDFKKHPLI